MKLQEINEGADVIIQLLVDDNLYTVDASVLINDMNGFVLLDIKPNKLDIDAVLKTKPTLSIGYVNSDKQYILFNNVLLKRGLYREKTVFAVQATEDGKFTDRRMFPRFIVDIPCVYNTESSEIFVECVLHDISRFGAAIITNSKLSSKDKLYLTFYNKYTKSSVNVEAKVVRSINSNSSFTYGLEITSTKDFESLIEALQKESFNNSRK